ncbi:LysR family transcriptional regulator [Facilibium subflavum]|uniref:LysR family transcriptional regulator n=1 Tax=Facilibium subflavum TaxID=2219058 RepID=UPI000E659753|nr:LysR family transcriptional regulator [Facilibium subflavum]
MAYNLTYKHVQIFLQVVELKSITAAANRLYLTQPAVTKQLKSLEAEVGKKLFYFDGKNTKLTVDGENFLPYAKKIQGAFSHLFTYLSNENKDYQLNLIVSPIFDEWVIQILKSVKQRYPKLNYNINFTTLEYTDFYERFNGDLIIASTPVKEKKYYCEEVGKIRCILVASSENKSLIDNPTLENILSQTFITPKVGSILHEFTLKKISKTTPLSIFSNAQVAKKAVIANLGIGWLPEFMVEKELKSGQLVSTRELFLKHENRSNEPKSIIIEGLSTYLAYSYDKPINKVMREFMQALMSISSLHNKELL